MTRLSFQWGQKICSVCLSVDDLTIPCLNCGNTARGKCLE